MATARGRGTFPQWAHLFLLSPAFREAAVDSTKVFGGEPPLCDLASYPVLFLNYITLPLPIIQPQSFDGGKATLVAPCSPSRPSSSPRLIASCPRRLGPSCLAPCQIAPSPPPCPARRGIANLVHRPDPPLLSLSPFDLPSPLAQCRGTCCSDSSSPMSSIRTRSSRSPTSRELPPFCLRTSVRPVLLFLAAARTVRPSCSNKLGPLFRRFVDVGQDADLVAQLPLM